MSFLNNTSVFAEDFLLGENIYLKYLRFSKKRRKYSVHPINQIRHIFGEFHHLYPQLRKHPDRFFSYTRMSIETFDFLLQQMRDKLEKKITNFRRPISPAERLIVTLRYLATGSSFNSLAFSFRMGRSTVSQIIYETCIAIWNQLKNKFMPVPTEKHLKKVINDYYQRWNFPNCFGSIDGKHCQIKCPSNSGSAYYNYLKYFSIVLQGVADADKKFLIINVGGYGKQHDATTFISSKLFSKLETNNFNVPRSSKIPDTDIILPNFLIGDKAYPLKTYLMRPYPVNGLTQSKERFNTRLSRARKCIECAFGILSQKFRFLLKDIETYPDKACVFIKCACLLHNLIRCKDGESDLDYRYMVNKIYGEENWKLSGNRPAHNLGRGMNNSSVEAKHKEHINYIFFN